MADDNDGLTLAQLIENCGDVQAVAFGQDIPPEVLGSDELADQYHLHITGLFTEVAEVAEQIGWKPWSAQRGEVFSRKALANEIADTLRFLFNIAAIAGLNGETIEQAFVDSGRETIRRQLDNYSQRRPTT